MSEIWTCDSIEINKIKNVTKLFDGMVKDLTDPTLEKYLKDKVLSELYWCEEVHIYLYLSIKKKDEPFSNYKWENIKFVNELATKHTVVLPHNLLLFVVPIKRFVLPWIFSSLCICNMKETKYFDIADFK
jgi:hypothetical protein